MSPELPNLIPGATFNIIQPIIDTVTEVVTGSSTDLAVILSGLYLGVLRGLAQESPAVDPFGAADAAIEQETEQPRLTIQLDREKITRFSVRDVQNLNELGDWRARRERSA